MMGIIKRIIKREGSEIERMPIELVEVDSSLTVGELSRKIEELESEGLSCRILVDTKSGNLILGCISSPKGKYEVRW